MPTRIVLSVLAVALSLACSEKDAPPKTRVPQQPPVPAESPFVLGLAINHDGSQRVIRGWPLVVRVSAALDREPTEAVPLPDASLTLRVLDAGGTAEPWPLVAPAAAEPDAVLDAANPVVERVRVLDAAATQGLAPGPRTIEVVWGPAAESFAVTVEDPPADTPASREARVLLEVDELLARGKLDAAVAGLDAALAASPRSVALLNQRALVHEQAGDLRAAYVDAQAAFAAFREQYPDAAEPPVTILEITGRLEDQVIGGAP